MIPRILELAAGGLALLAMVVLCALLGGRLRPWLDRPGLERGFRLALELIVGVVVLHLLLGTLDLLGVAWRWPALLPAVGLTALALHGVGRAGRRTGRDRTGSPRDSNVLYSTEWHRVVGRQEEPGWNWGWGDSVAAVALGLFGLWAALGWAVNPDFIYHWGAKGHRFFLHGGIDVAFLLQPWMQYAHPGYPNLLPELFAATAVAGGGWREPAMFAWTAVFAAALWPAARQSMAEAGTGRFGRQATLAALGLLTAAFGTAYLLAGGPDTILALAPLAAWPAMLVARRPGLAPAELAACDLQVGFVAALAAGAKMEGMAMAVFLVGVYWVAGRRLTGPLTGRGAPRLAALGRTLLPTLAVIGLWAARGLRSGLFTESHAGGLDLGRLPTVLRAAAEAASIPEWHGLAWIVLLVPLLAWPPQTRALAWICGLQLACYLAVYLTAPMADTAAVRFYVLSSFSRLLFHLAPATLVAAGVALASWAAAARRPTPS